MYIICAIKVKDVATVDIPDDFVHVNIEGNITHVKIDVKMTELLEKFNPNLYTKCIPTESSKLVIYVKNCPLGHTISHNAFLKTSDHNSTRMGI